MLNPKSHENSRPDGIGVLEIINGPAPEHPRLFVPLKRTGLSGEVLGPFASLRLIQVYGYSKNQCDKVLEAVYRFPLPGDAAITRVHVSFGDVEIEAELKERAEAQTDYEEAKRQGRQAALATREAPDVFTLQVAGIRPGEEIKVVTSYIQLARVEGPNWSLRIPLTTSPRYVRSDELTSRHAHGQPVFLLRDPGHRFSLDLTLRGVESVESRTYQLDISRENDAVRARLRDGEVVPDRDCVLTWRAQGAQNTAALQVWLHDDPASSELYFLALVAPPAARFNRRIPREVVLLVDHSGSMEGAKWQAADWAVESFLTGMAEPDAFALGLFHSTTQWFARDLRQADPKSINEALAFLKKSKDSGGTELGVALEQALSLNRVSGEYARHTLIITDAEVTDAGRILRLASEETSRADRRRISVLCIDAAPNSFLASTLAERGGGVAKFLTSDPEEEDITTALDEVLADWAEPVLANLRLEVNRTDAGAAGRQLLSPGESGWSAIDLGDMPAGRAVWVVGRIPRGQDTDLKFRVKASSDWEMAASHSNLKQAACERPAIKALFGAPQVWGLEHLIHSGYSGDDLREELARLGYDPERVLAPPASKHPKVYAENVRAEADKALRILLVREALNYGLASSETAFVAVRKEAGRVIEATVAVANALPSGWSEQFECSMSLNLAMSSAPSAAMRACMSGLQMSVACEADEEGLVTPARENRAAVFSGTPQFVNGEAVLFDSMHDQATVLLPDEGTIRLLELRFPDGAPDAASLDLGLSLLIYIDDFSAERARVRLADIVRQRGERPLNLKMRQGQVVRIILVDKNGVWSQAVPHMEVALEWER